MIKKILNKLQEEITLSYFFTGLSFIVFMFVIYLSDGIKDPGDGLAHFIIAKFSWQHPNLFLDSWGKPLFTLLSSPFAQFGFNGMIVFNAMLFVSTSIYAIKITDRFDLKFKWLMPFLLIGAPVYFNMVIAGMTEILFSAVLIASLYYLIKEQYVIAAVLFSFIFFVRPEGLIVFPFYLIFFLLRSWKHSFLLMTGGFVYSLAAYFMLDNMFLFIEYDQYPGAKEIYGAGEFFHFFKYYNQIIGKSLVYLLLLGLVLVGIKFIRTLKRKKGKIIKSRIIIWQILVTLPFLAVVFTHSYLWWKGLKGSLGLLRVLATVTPLASLLALYGINGAYNVFKKKKNSTWIFNIIAFIIAGSLIFSLSLEVELPIRPKPAERLISKTSTWINKQGFNGKIFWLAPYFTYVSGADPYDEEKTGFLWGLDQEKPSKTLEQGDIIVWDSHFGPNEGHLKLQNLLEDNNLMLEKSFYPNKQIGQTGGRDFCLNVFSVDTLKSRSMITPKTLFTFPTGIDKINAEFLNLIKTPVNYSKAKILAYSFSAEIYFSEPYLDETLQIIVSIGEGVNNYYYAKKIKASAFKINKWNKVFYQIYLPVFNNREIASYFWNINQQEFKVRNVKGEVLMY